MRLPTTPALLGATVLGLSLSGLAAAAESGDWMVRAGASFVAPKSDNGTLALDRLGEIPPADIEVDDGTSFTFTVSYFFTQNWAVELLAAYPFNHDFDIDDVGLEGEVDHLPPTLSVQYHFPMSATVKPYVGLGVNWTMFFDEDLNAPLDVDLDDSVGLAGQVGVDIALNDAWSVNFDLRYIDIASDVEVEGIDVGEVEIDPWVFGINVGYTF